MRGTGLGLMLLAGGVMWGQECVGGYRVAGIRRDAVLGRTWIVMASCTHPERPVSLLAVPGEVTPGPERATSVAPAKTLPVEILVRAGDEVRAWSNERRVRMEVTAVAEESGGLGATIHVRVKAHPAESGSEPQRFTVLVRGRGDVEMKR